MIETNDNFTLEDAKAILEEKKKEIAMIKKQFNEKEEEKEEEKDASGDNLYPDELFYSD